MKNSDKINNVEICKTLIGVKNKEFAFESVSTLYEHIKNSPEANLKKVAHAVLVSGTHKEYNGVELCRAFIENKVYIHKIGLNL